MLLAIALAMDAFAVALTQGARFRPSWGAALLISLAFGVAQGVMPLIGWSLGAVAFDYIEAFDHWIAFGLLAFLGLRMIFAAHDPDEDEGGERLAGWPLLAAAIATSIDALAAGITLPTLAVDPFLACTLIALVTFALSLVAVGLGRKAGESFGRPAEILGGIILIGLGTKILLEHTGWL